MPSELREKLCKAIYSVDFGLAKWDGDKYMAMSNEDVNKIVDRIMAVLPLRVESYPTKPVHLLQNDPDVLSLEEKIELFKAMSILIGSTAEESGYNWNEKIDGEVFKLLKTDLYVRVKVAYSRDVADSDEEATE